MRRVVLFPAILLSMAFVSCGAENPSSTDQEAEAEFDFSGDLIAFRSDRDGNDDIWLMTPDGSESINITNNNSADSDPSWSPDGSRIAFVSTRTGNAELFVMDVDGSNVIQVTDNQGSVRWPNWSPDGSMIAFSANVNDQRDLYIIPAPGVNSKQSINKLTTCDGLVQITDHPEVDNEPVWSPDGGSLYFFSTHDGSGGVWEIDLSCEGGKNRAKLTFEFEFGCSPAVGWTIEGTLKLSFVGKQEDQYDIWVKDLSLDLNSSKEMVAGHSATRKNLSAFNVTNHPATDWSSTWTDEGDRLFFDTDRNDNWDIYSVNEDGSDVTPITNHPSDDRYPAWRP